LMSPLMGAARKEKLIIDKAVVLVSLIVARGPWLTFPGLQR
jgi:hypothetical protein